MAAPHPEGTLVYSTREWVGEYFSRDVPGGVEKTPVRSSLWRIGPDGTGRQHLKVAGDRAEHPLAGPDGRWIYWQSETEGHWRICRARGDGSDLGVVAPAAGLDAQWVSAYGPAISADGAHLTYTVYNGTEGRVVLARADGSEARVLAPDFGYAYMAAPDANATQVVFSGPARDYRLAIVDGAGGAPRVLTPGHPDSYVPQFTPDGSAIIFIRRDGGLYRVAPDGSDLRRLTAGVQVEFFLSPQDAHGSTDFPAIAPDGRQVAFVARDASGVPNVFTIGPDGSDRRQVTLLPGACGRVRWSPDSRWLAFVSFAGPRPQLFIVPADGSDGSRQLTAEPGAVHALSWLPSAP
jgi:Tol biopolymer transport system component